MPPVVSTPPYLSLSKIIRATQPKEELEDELLACLSIHLKSLGIRWSPSAFRAGLNNSQLPEGLLRRLEDFLSVSGTLDWALPKTFVDELDRLIEDIESFNPSFVKALRASSLSGRLSSAVVKKRLGL